MRSVPLESRCCRSNRQFSTIKLSSGLDSTLPQAVKAGFSARCRRADDCAEAVALDSARDRVVLAGYRTGDRAATFDALRWGPPLTFGIGLLIAAPALWLHRGLSGEVELLLFETDRMSLSIIDQVRDQIRDPCDD